MSSSGQQAFFHGVVIIPRPSSDADATTIAGSHEETGRLLEITAVRIPTADYDPDAIVWTPSPVSALLGLPVELARWPCADNKLRVQALKGFFMICDPADVAFGKVATNMRGFMGGVVMRKVDGGVLGKEDVEVLIAYLSEISEEMTGFSRAPHEGEVRELMARILTRGALRGFWEGYKAEKVAEGVKGWEGVDCPV